MSMRYATSSAAQMSSTPACAACKIQRKRCSEECVLVPYFPPDSTDEFLLLHRVFGNGRIIKLLKGLPAERRNDAVRSMVYEASERVRDPVHGCVGVIKDLQNKVSELQSQLASTEAEVAIITQQHANLLAMISGYHEVSESDFYIPSLQESENARMDGPVLDDMYPLQLWEPL
eukprot:PITA_11569